MRQSAWEFYAHQNNGSILRRKHWFVSRRIKRSKLSSKSRHFPLNGLARWMRNKNCNGVDCFSTYLATITAWYCHTGCIQDIMKYSNSLSRMHLVFFSDHYCYEVRIEYNIYAVLYPVLCLSSGPMIMTPCVPQLDKTKFFLYTWRGTQHNSQHVQDNNQWRKFLLQGYNKRGNIQWPHVYKSSISHKIRGGIIANIPAISLLISQPFPPTYLFP